MKALKEKRVSLRSVLRGGLVILSLLALVFAGCSDSDDDGNNGGQGPVTPPPTPAGPTAVTINIMKQPGNWSFQGCPPDISDVVLEVRWSDGTVGFVSGDLGAQGFYAVPPYCEDASPKANGGTAGTFQNYEHFLYGLNADQLAIPNTSAPFNPSVGKFTIMHKGSTAISNELILPGVIPLFRVTRAATTSTVAAEQEPYRGNNTPLTTGLNLTTLATEIKWYADQRPDYSSDFVLEGYYEWWSETPWTGADGAMQATYAAAAGDIRRDGTEYMEYWSGDNGTLTPTYPIDFSLGSVKGKQGAYVVYTNPSTQQRISFDGTLATAWEGGCDKSKRIVIPMNSAYPPFDLSQAKTTKRIRVTIGGLLGSVGPVYDAELLINEYIEILGIEYSNGNFPDIFDDSFEYTNDNNQLNKKVPGSAAARTKAMVEAAEPNFKVIYTDGTDRPIDWVEFKANHEYYNQVGGTPSTVDWYFGNDGEGKVGGATDTSLLYDEDTGEWNIVLEYVPVDYGTAAYINRVNVPIEVWLFDDAEVLPKPNTGGKIQVETVPGSVTNAPMTDELLEAINQKWELIGHYTRGTGGTRDRSIPFEKDFFIGVGVSRSASTPAANISLWSAESYNTDYVGKNMEDIYNEVTHYNWTGAAPVAEPGTVFYLRDFDLPLVYRADAADRLVEEDTVLIDLYIKK